MRFLSKIFFITAILLALFVPTKQTSAQSIDSLVKVFDQISEQLLYRNNDTNYIQNYGDQLAAKIVGVNKINYFGIKDKSSGNRLKYRPVRDVSLGIGLAYKFFAFDLTLSLGLGDRTGLENTRSLDFQARMFSSKQLVSTTFQYYQGYKLSNFNDQNIDPNNEQTKRADLRTMNLMLQYTYAFNYTKFSMKAPFVFNERQKKSAGSVIGGVSFSLFNMSADSSIIPSVLSSDFYSTTNLTGINVVNLGVKAGYMYTYVYKNHYFVTLSLMPGIILNYGDYSLDFKHELPTYLNLSLSTMNSVGYNGHRFFAGFSYILDHFNIRVDSYTKVNVGSGKMTAFVGYRFGKF